MITQPDGAPAHARRRPDTAPSGVAERVRSFRSFLEGEAEHLLKRHRFGLGGREIARGRSDAVDVVVGRICRAIAQDLGPAAGEELSACAVVAVGGYGRRDLAPCSDVDLLFLHPRRLSPAMKDFVEGALPLLWDSGLEVGHSVRSVADCVSMGAKDLHARNAMSEARLLVGNPEVYARFQTDMWDHVYRSARANRAFMKAMRAELDGRRARFGSVVAMQEPHVKEGAGGLRDLHTVDWVALACYGARGAEELGSTGLVDHAEHARARRAYDFLLRVRNELHFQSGRRTDLLPLEAQPALAESLGYSDQRAASASEIFMRDFYLRARELQSFGARFLRRSGLAGPTRREALVSRARALGPHGLYRISGDELEAAPGRDVVDGEPERLLQAFEVAQAHDVRLGHELHEAVRRNLRLADRRFRASATAAEVFMRILGRRGRVAPILRDMHEVGLLARYLPEFGRVTLMVQHDHYHRYTIDEHTLQTLERLDLLQRLASGPEPRALAVGGEAARPDAARRDGSKGAPGAGDANALAPGGERRDGHATGAGGRVESPRAPGASFLVDAAREVRDPSVLALALLLHDVGKGQGGGHVARGAAAAERVCARLGLGEERTRDVVFLVGKHLVMSQVSQRRDLSDEAVIEGFAETVGTVDRLNMLFVLTFADIDAVGPGVWNGWKAALLEELYVKTLTRLTPADAGSAHADDHQGGASRHPGGIEAAPDSRRIMLEEKILRGLDAQFLRSDVEEFLIHLPDRYLRLVAADSVARHFQMVRELGARTLLSDWRSAARAPYTTLSVCLRDRTGVLATLAGILTASGLDILSVDVFTRDDGVVLDVFRVAESMRPVRPVAEDRWPAIEAELIAALEGRRDVAAGVARRRAGQPRRRKRRPPMAPTVRFEEQPDELGRTRIEVRADDEPGLVYRIAATLAELELDILLAKIATEKSHALDTFYVAAAGGAALPPDERATVEKALLAALAR